MEKEEVEVWEIWRMKIGEDKCINYQTKFCSNAAAWKICHELSIQFINIFITYDYGNRLTVLKNKLYVNIKKRSFSSTCHQKFAGFFFLSSINTFLEYF